MKVCPSIEWFLLNEVWFIRTRYTKFDLSHKSCFSGYEIFGQEKRPESEAGSQSSKSFELLKISTDCHNSNSSSNNINNSNNSNNNNNPGSGHTSGDDLETFTTTSSDIEVISSPGFSEKSTWPVGGSPVASSKHGKAELTINKHFKKGKFLQHKYSNNKAKQLM